MIIIIYIFEKYINLSSFLKRRESNKKTITRSPFLLIMKRSINSVKFVQKFLDIH